MSEETMPGPSGPLDWDQVERLARSLPAKINLVVPKTQLPDAPPHRRSWMGRRRGAIRQFRCHRREHNLHIKEYGDRWVVHVDRWNPHQSMVRHLLVDHGYDTFVPLEPPRPTPSPVPA